LRITHNAEDSLLEQYIEDARIYAENYTGRKIITQTVTAYYDDLNGRDADIWEGTRVGAYSAIYGEKYAELEFGPVASITEVNTIDLDNAETVYSSSDYYLDNYDDDLKARMMLNRGATITGALRAANNIKVEYVAGYGNASAVPSALRRAVIMLVGAMYANRGDCTDVQAQSCGASPLLDQYRYKDA